MASAHDNLKRQFEEFQQSVLKELIAGTAEAPISRVDSIENRLARIEKFIFGDVSPSRIITPGG